MEQAPPRSGDSRYNAPALSLIDYQRRLLQDRVRCGAFEQALREVIRPGVTTVTDIGSGTGFLAFLARKLGAVHCTLIEQSEDLLRLSRALARENGITALSFVCANSREVRRPTCTDVVVSETLGNIALEEGILDTLVDAPRFLSPGGILVPRSLTQDIAPLTSERLWRELLLWETPGALQWARAREIAASNAYVRTVQREEIVPWSGALRQWDELAFGQQRTDHVRRGDEVWTAESACTVHGFVLSWRARLTDGVSLSTSPGDPPTHWEQIVLPILHPLTLAQGDRLHLRLTVDVRPAVRIDVTWHTEHRDAAGRVLHGESRDMQSGLLG